MKTIQIEIVAEIDLDAWDNDEVKAQKYLEGCIKLSKISDDDINWLTVRVVEQK